MIEGVEKGFGSFPPGCHMHLQWQTREQLLQGLQALTVQNWRRPRFAAGAPSPNNPRARCPGNRPSAVVVLPALTPHTLGALLALYEHRTFVSGVVWRINPFDQFGVELGKRLAGTLDRELRGEQVAGAAHDASTAALLGYCQPRMGG